MDITLALIMVAATPFLALAGSIAALFLGDRVRRRQMTRERWGRQ